jgi:hypothetical protein
MDVVQIWRIRSAGCLSITGRNGSRIEECLDSCDLPADDFDAVADVLDAMIRVHVEDRRDMIALDDVPRDSCASNTWQDQFQKAQYCLTACDRWPRRALEHNAVRKWNAGGVFAGETSQIGLDDCNVLLT